MLPNYSGTIKIDVAIRSGVPAAAAQHPQHLQHKLQRSSKIDMRTSMMSNPAVTMYPLCISRHECGTNTATCGATSGEKDQSVKRTTGNTRGDNGSRLDLSRSIAAGSLKVTQFR